MKTLKDAKVDDVVVVKRLHGEARSNVVSWTWESQKEYRSKFVRLHHLVIQSN